MKKILSFFLLIFLLNACENLEKGLGMRKDVPNEFKTIVLWKKKGKNVLPDRLEFPQDILILIRITV